MEANIVPSEDLPSGLVPASDLPDVVAKSQPTMLGDIADIGKAIGREFIGGAKQAFAPTYSNASPSATEKYLTTPVMQLLGAGRMLASPLQAVMHPAEVGTTRVGETLGLPPEITDVAAKTAGGVMGLLAPSGLANLLPNLATKTLRGLTGAGVRPLRAAEALNTTNAAENDAAISAYNAAKESAPTVNIAAQAANKAKQAEYADAIAKYNDTQTNLSRYESRLARTVPDVGPNQAAGAPASGQVVSPIAQELRATPTDAGIYKQFDAIKETQTAQLDHTLGSLDKIIARYGEDIAPALKPATALKAAEGLGGAATGTLGDAETLKSIMGQFQAVGGKLTLDKFQTNMQGIGRLVNSNDERVSNAASNIYANMRKDAATTPGGQLLLKANSEFNQNLAADAVGKIIGSKSVTSFSKEPATYGNLTINTANLKGELARDTERMKWIRDAIPPKQLQEVQDTINNVFKIKQSPEAVAPKAPKLASEAVKQANVPEPKLLPTNNQPTPEQVSRIGHFQRFGITTSMVGLAHAMGVPLPAGGGVGAAVYLSSYVPQLYSKAIFNVAQTSSGRTLLRALYHDSAPNLGDIAKAAALTRFLHAQSTSGGPNGQ